jgi:threonine/homoserine/homoserine lactone efflux protein
MSTSSLAPYLLTCLIIELTPGPNMGFLALVAATKGRRLGFSTIAGITLGLLIVGLMAAAGVATLVERSAFLYETLRFGGGAYLLWIAFQHWRESTRPSDDRALTASTMRLYFRHGLTVNLLNPKAAIFYIAILPTYLSVDLNQGGSTVLAATGLTLIYVGIATAIHLIIVMFAGTLQPLLQNDRVRKITTRGFALLLALIAIWMVLGSAR